ncbi:Ig-like domain-containing protein [Bifidobacterium pseudolongum]|uniref:SpaA isopeptide-forming pilin-related protein n=1 Tax=Bifidobacterium pseudolongum TaxID=1694 RepID=UPI001F0FA7D9|nr:SpaA isopeptide-forming pilin-related protein [Bifidobacterium pseudolongum]MCH4852693.1 Ig-like domain-containing protein [Bifidobacterium pseudolongum]
MMFATAVPALMPQTAHAAEAGICQPEDISLGDTTTGGTIDGGVATWVGRDMYVGAPTGSPNYGKDGAEIAKSYAVEAEGATLVAGKLAINSQKNSWENRGFRFGIVGFGAQYRPAAGSDALVVAGTNSVINLKGGDGKDTNALGWAARWGRGWVGTLKSGEWNYNARISGDKSQTVYDYSGQRNDSVYGANDATPHSEVYWEQTNPLASVKLNGAAGPTSDYSNNTKTIQDMSATLAAIPVTEDALSPTVENSGTYENGKYNGTVQYNKYNSGQMNPDGKRSPYIGANITFANDNGKKEKIIVFDGNNTTAKTIVFSISGSQLADGNEYNGTSFMFKNIPDDASVVINVSGSDPISFHNGWRFWWNGEQIGNGYYHGSTPAVKKAYERAAQAIMWNFHDTSYLKIEGGVLTSGQAVRWANVSGTNNMATTVDDDPAAAMIGSIMVPNGSFEDHVTTNGRVWVGQDFMMYNPTVAATFGAGLGEGDSASILDMDQERHNFPWTGSMRSECSAVAWSKVDASGNLLPGTSWGLYGSLEDAKARRNGIYPNIKDNDIPSGDWDNRGGKFRVDSLTPGFDYYIREIESVAGHKLNDNIYVINATNKGNTANTVIKAVYTGAGTLINNPGDQGMMNVAGTTTPAIVNPDDAGKVTWGKYAEGSTPPYKGLGGSEWNLQKQGSETIWTITDNTTSVTGLKVYNDEQMVADSATPTVSPLAVGEFQQIQLSPVVEPASASQRVLWESNNENVHVSNGLVNVIAYPGDGVRVTITVTTEDTDAEGNPISVVIPLTITPADVESLTVKNGETIVHDGASITVEAGNNLQLSASVTPTNLRPTYIWTSENPAIATVDATGNVHGVAHGETVITVQAGNKQQRIPVTVTANSYPLTIYIQWNKQPLIHIYDVGSGGTGTNWDSLPQMTAVAGCGSGWYEYKVPFGSGTEFSFMIVNKDNKDDRYGMKISDIAEFQGLKTSGGGFYTEVKAMGNASAYLIQDGKLTIGKPSCAASNSIMENSFVTPQSNLTVEDLTSTLEPSNAANTPVMRRARLAPMRAAENNDGAPKDESSKEGEFSVALENGTYTLWEKTAPAGYTINPTKYQFTINNGKVEWIGNVKPSIVNGVGWIPDTPTKVTWQKVDEQDTSNLLGDSQWGIYEVKDGVTSSAPVQLIDDCVASSAQACATRYANQTYYDSDPEKGKFAVEKLPTGTYVLKETVAPGGYQLLTETKQFTVDATSEDAVNINVGSIPNKRLLGTVDWTKVSSEALDTPLAGAEWKIKFKAEGATSFSEEYIVTDCASGTCAVPEKPSQPAWTYDRDATPGVFKLSDLAWGEYQFTESKAPDGYYPSDKTYTFTVSKDNLSGITISVDGATALASGNKIPNTPGFELPETGGEGNTLIVLFGFALTAISMLGCAIAMRKRI